MNTQDSPPRTDLKKRPLSEHAKNLAVGTGIGYAGIRTGQLAHRLTRAVPKAEEAIGKVGEAASHAGNLAAAPGRAMSNVKGFMKRLFRLEQKLSHIIALDEERAKKRTAAIRAKQRDLLSGTMWRDDPYAKSLYDAATQREEPRSRERLVKTKDGYEVKPGGSLIKERTAFDPKHGKYTERMIERQKEVGTHPVLNKPIYESTLEPAKVSDFRPHRAVKKAVGAGMEQTALEKLRKKLESEGIRPDSAEARERTKKQIDSVRESLREPKQQWTGNLRDSIAEDLRINRNLDRELRRRNPQMEPGQRTKARVQSRGALDKAYAERTAARATEADKLHNEVFNKTRDALVQKDKEYRDNLKRGTLTDEKLGQIRNRWHRPAYNLTQGSLEGKVEDVVSKTKTAQRKERAGRREGLAQKHSGIAGVDINEAARRYRDLKNPDFASHRNIRRQLIQEGDIFKGVGGASPKWARTDLTKTPLLKGAGIAAGVIGAGVLAKKLMGRKRQEARPQLMSSRRPIIQFGKKWNPTPLAERLIAKSEKAATKEAKKRVGKAKFTQVIKDPSQFPAAGNAAEWEARMAKMREPIDLPSELRPPASTTAATLAQENLNPEHIKSIASAAKTEESAYRKGLRAKHYPGSMARRALGIQGPHPALDKGAPIEQAMTFYGKTPKPIRSPRPIKAKGKSALAQGGSGDEALKDVTVTEAPKWPASVTDRYGYPPKIPLSPEAAMRAKAADRKKLADQARGVIKAKRHYKAVHGEDIDAIVPRMRSENATLKAKYDKDITEAAEHLSSFRQAVGERRKKDIKKVLRGARIASNNQKAAHSDQMEAARGRMHRNVAIGVGAGLVGGAALAGNGKQPEKQPKRLHQFSAGRVPAFSLNAARRNVKEAWGGMNTAQKIAVPAAWAAGTAIDASLAVASKGLTAVPGVGTNKILPVLAHRALRTREASDPLGRSLGKLAPVKSRLPDVSGYYRKDPIGYSSRSKLIQFLSREQRENLEGAARMGASAGISGGVGGLAVGLLSRPRIAPSWSKSKPAPVLKKLGRAAKLATKAGLGLGVAGAGAGLLGSAFLGAPKQNDSTAFTKRGAIGGAVTGAVGGAILGGLSLRPGKAHRILARYSKTWLPVERMQKMGPAGRMAVGAGLGTIVGAAHLADEGQQVDTMRNLKKPVRMSSRTPSIRFGLKKASNEATSRIASVLNKKVGMDWWNSGMPKKALPLRVIEKDGQSHLLTYRRTASGGRDSMTTPVSGWAKDPTLSTSTNRESTKRYPAIYGRKGGEPAIGTYAIPESELARASAHLGEQEIRHPDMARFLVRVRSGDRRLSERTTHSHPIIRLAEAPLTGKLAADRYRKKIHDEDLDRRDANILRTSAAGALLGAILKGKRGAIAGAGSGAASIPIIRAGTNSGKDMYGERTRTGKRIEGLPWKAALLGAGAIGARKLWTRKFSVSRSPIVRFDEDADFRRWQDQMDEARGEARDWRKSSSLVNKATQGVRRGTALVGDAISAAKGQKKVDSRGRDLKREWEKPWFKRAVTGTIAIGSLAAFRTAMRRTGPGTGFQRLKKLHEEGRVTEAMEKKVPGFKKAREFVGKFKRQGQDEMASKSEGILGKAANWVENASKSRRVAPTATPESRSAASEITKILQGDPKTKLRIKELAEKLDNAILFRAAHDDLDDFATEQGKQVRSYRDAHEKWLRLQPGKTQRERREKKLTEKKAFRDSVVVPAEIGGAFVGGGILGKWMSHREPAVASNPGTPPPGAPSGKIINMPQSASHSEALTKGRVGRRAARAVQKIVKIAASARGPILTLSAKLDRAISLN